MLEFLKHTGVFFDYFTVWLVTFELLLLVHREKRNQFGLRLLLFLPLLIIPNNAFSELMPWNVRFHSLPVFVIGDFNWAFLFLYVVSLFIIWFCFAIPFRQVVFYGTAAYILEHLSQHIKWILLEIVVGDMTHNFDEAWYPLLLILSKVLVISFVYLVLVRPYRHEHELGVNNLFLIAFAVASMLIVSILSSFISARGYANAMTSAITAVCCVLLLTTQFSVFKEAKSREAESHMASLLIKQSQQQTMKKDSIDTINRKVHDLKYRMSFLNAMPGQDDLDELLEINDAISTYDGVVETGNAILDIILTEAAVLCWREGIRFSVSGDAARMSFMGRQDLASLFGNAVDNAIEYERRIAPEFRNIDVIFRTQGNLLKVSVENYCTRKLVFVDGIPQSTKDNTNGDHGYGVRSIMHTVKKYGGIVNAYQEDDRYILSMLFNVSQQEKQISSF